MVGYAPHVVSDGHFVVIQDDNQRFMAGSGIVQPLIGQAASGCPVPNEGKDAVMFLLQGPGPGHAQGNGHRIGGMSCHKSVCYALRRLGETGNAAKTPQRRKLISAVGENFMNIGLVAHIKDQTVHLGIKDSLQGHGQLHHTQVGGQMAAGLGYV